MIPHPGKPHLVQKFLARFYVRHKSSHIIFITFVILIAVFQRLPPYAVKPHRLPGLLRKRRNALLQEPFQIGRRLLLIHLKRLLLKILLLTEHGKQPGSQHMVIQPGYSHGIPCHAVQAAISEDHVIIPYGSCINPVAHRIRRLIEKTACDTAVIIFGDFLHQIFPDKGIHVNIFRVMLSRDGMNPVLL